MNNRQRCTALKGAEKEVKWIRFAAAAAASHEGEGAGHGVYINADMRET